MRYSIAGNDELHLNNAQKYKWISNFSLILNLYFRDIMKKIDGRKDMVSILVVEDDEKLNQLFCSVLERNHFQPFAATNGMQAMDILEKGHMDLIITDLMMPEMDGFELVEQIRLTDSHMPILMITAKDTYEDMREGFSKGTDDYMVKPIDINEMILRVKALLRRAQIVAEQEIMIGSTCIRRTSLTITIHCQEILLPQKEFELLFKLASNPNKIYTRQQLMDEIWGFESDSDERTIDVHVNRLRDKLKICQDLKIVTVRGLGYKVVVEHEE